MSAREAIARMRERAEAATEGPWEMLGGYEYVSPIGLLVAPDDGGVTSEDAEFIAHARTDLPALVEIAQALEGYVADLDYGEPMNADDVQVLRDLLDGLEVR